MKKLLLAALLPWLCLVLLQAQDRPLPEKLRHLYAPLNKTRVPTGYLWDQSLCLASPGNYQGQLDTFYANPDVFGMFYGALRNSYVGKPDGNLPVPSVYLNSIKTPPADGAIPLALMAMQYDRIRPDAFSSHLLGYNGTQVQELPNQQESPYYQDTVYVLTPLQTTVQGLQLVIFRLPETLWFSNLGQAPDISFDAGDGSGWHKLAPGSDVRAQYTSGGSKILRIRLAYQGWTRYASSKIEVTASNNSGSVAERSGMEWPRDLYDAIPVTATKSYMGAAGQATMHIFYNTSNCNGAKRLLRPLILIEGYEQAGITTSSYNRMFDLLNDEVLNDKTENLTDHIYPAEYDLVYIDLANGSDWIQRNAFVVEEVIKKVNEMKAAAGSTEQNVIIGVSMGGVVGKYALADMKTNGPAHDTRLYFTYDSPLRGANIPIGTQCLIKFMVDNLGDYAEGNISIPGIDAVWSAIQAPTPRQLLLSHVNTLPSVGDPNLQTAFLAELDALGALDMRHVAIGNGSDNGTFLENSMTAGTPFLDFYGQYIQCEEWPANSNVIHCGDVNFNVTLRATGNFTATEVFHGRIEKNMPYPPESSSVEWTVTYTSRPYDVIPGGTSNLGVGPLGTATGGLLFSLIGAGVAITGPGLTAAQHCFIPSFSSANAPMPSSFTTPQSCGAVSRCSQSSNLEVRSPYTGLFEYNQYHIGLDSRIANLLIEELVTNSPAPTPNVLEFLPNHTLSTYYNAGLGIYAKAIPDLTIMTASGKLSINNSGKVAYAIGNEPLAQDNYLEAYMKCGSLITVETGASIVVGADQGERHGALFCTDGSVIHVKSGGTLRITSEKSKLVVMKGGRLILDPGAIVQIEQSESVLRIEGELVVNGDITFSGKGYFDFAGKPEQLVFGQGYSMFKLSGSAANQRFVRLSTPLWVNEAHRLDWSNGWLEAVGGGIALFKESGVSFMNMTITGAEYLTALEMLGAGEQYLTRCNFTTFDKVIHSENSGSIYIRRSQFDQIGAAVEAVSNPGWLTIEGSSFSNYGSAAIQWLESSPVKISYSTFEGGKGNSALFLTDIPYVVCDGSYFNNHKDEFTSVKQAASLTPAVYIDNGLSVFKNSHFQNNTLGIKSLTLLGEGAEAAAVLLVNGSSFYGNDIGVYMEGNETKGLVLADCTTFFNNANGIAGSDITLMLDSYYTSVWSGDTDTPNMFVRDNQLQGGTTDAHISVCYNAKSAANSKMMRNNWWGIWDANSNAPIYDPQPEDIISLYQADCSAIAVQEMISPRPQKQPDACILEGKPDNYGNDDNTLTSCTVNTGALDGAQASVNQKWHEGFYLLKTDEIELGIEILKPVADLWQSDMSSYDDNCRSYIAVAKAIVDGNNAQNRSKLNEMAAGSGLLVTPNPAHNHFSVKLSDVEQHVVVYNLQGTKMFESLSAKGSLEVYAEHWPTGTYIVHAMDVTGHIRLAKVVVE